MSWEKPYDPTLQLRGLVLKDKQGFSLIQGASTDLDRLAMSFAAYNGGSGGLNSDRRACAGTKNCNPGIWFGHVEKTSLKAKTAVHGYGKSFFEINREYVANILVVRRAKYLPMDDASKAA
jgi:membrane-bound lytic murein transglycosylase MltF